MDDFFTPPPTPPVPPAAPPPPLAPVPPPINPTPTPLDPKARRKIMLKRLEIVLGVSYLILLAIILTWALFAYGKEFSIFNYLPIAQASIGNALMKLYHILIGVVVGVLLLLSLFGVLKSLLTKRDELEKKKKASRLALFSGIGFFTFAILWLLGIWFLGPRLVTEERFGSPILTTPEQTLGLSSPVSITFDASQLPVDEDIYRILSYTWDFGDGAMANGEIVTHEYTKKAPGNGIYTVTLNVDYMDLKSGQTFDYETSTQVSIENERTAASFTVMPDSGEVPLEVHFDATSSYDPDGEILTYEWDFDGDGRFDDAEGEEVDHTFNQEGDYDVSLRVTDNNGESAIATQSIEAGSVGGLRAVITPPLEEGQNYYVDEEYEFSGNLSQIDQGKIVKYSWNFGDGSDTLQSRSVRHRYEETGIYTLTLTVADADGNADETSLEITVLTEGSAPVAKISTTPALENGMVSGPVPLEVSFDASGSTDEDDDIVDYEWDFDNDGQFDDTGNKSSHTYQELGSYEARLQVTDSVGNTDESSVTVEVTEQGVVARLEVDTTNGEVPLTVHFDASSSTYKEGSIVSYEYDFGDGSDPYIGGSTVTYKYTSVGTFTATVTVVGGDGKKDSESLQIVVRPVSLTACFTVNTDSGTAPLFVSVDPSCSQGTIKSYEWNFGDGEISFDRKPETHTYDKIGTYTITLEVTADNGIVDTFTKTVSVK